MLTTERRVSMTTAEQGGSTTVAMDFGRLTIDEDLQLYLFGTPGQKRFDFIREIVNEGLLGYIVVLDDQRPDSLLEAIEIIAYFREHADVPYVVAINKVNAGEGERAVRRARHQLRIEDGIRVVTVDARDRDQAKGLLIELFHATRDAAARRHATESSAEVSDLRIETTLDSPAQPAEDLEHERTW